MSEGISQLASDESEFDGGHRPESDDRLLTARLPPMTPPPMARHPSGPPSDLSGAFVPVSAGPSPYRDVTIPGQGRTSWWREILTATFPPPAMSVRPPLDERVLERRIGATCAGMALGFVIVALALALRGADAASSPAVDAALVVARAVMAMGFLAFGLALLQMGERFFTGRLRRGGAARPSTPDLT